MYEVGAGSESGGVSEATGSAGGDWAAGAAGSTVPAAPAASTDATAALLVCEVAPDVTAAPNDFRAVM
jgi:hypothetical protein